MWKIHYLTKSAFPHNILRSKHDAASLAWALSSCEVHLSTDSESSFWIFVFLFFSDKWVWCDSEEPCKNCFEASFFAVLNISSCSSNQVNFSCPHFVVWHCIQSSWYDFSCFPFQRAEISWCFLSFWLQLSSADSNLWHFMSFSASSCSNSAMHEFAGCRLSQRSFFAVSEAKVDLFSAWTSFALVLAEAKCCCHAVVCGMTNQYLQVFKFIWVRLIHLKRLYLKFMS